MNTIDTNQLLMQLRAAAAQTKAPAAAPAQVEQSGAANFSSLLTQSIGKVNEMQKTSGAMTRAFEMGDPNVTTDWMAGSGLPARCTLMRAPPML